MRASGIKISGMRASGIKTSGMRASGMTMSGMKASDMRTSDSKVFGTMVSGMGVFDLKMSGMMVSVMRASEHVSSAMLKVLFLNHCFIRRLQFFMSPKELCVKPSDCYIFNFLINVESFTLPFAMKRVNRSGRRTLP